MNLPRGVAASPTTGNVFVADRSNARIDVFSVWGEFVRAWGFGVDTGAAQLEVCTTASTCQAGIEGSGPGQLGIARSVAVDSAGFVYVYDGSNNRVTKYTEAGAFVLTFGGNVNKTTGAEVCTEASGDLCGAGEVGTAPGFFANESVGIFLTIGPAGTIFVGDKSRIQEFNLDGSFKAEIPFTGDLASLAGLSVYALAADPVSGDLYMSFNNNGDLYRISSTGALVDVVEDTEVVNGSPKTFPANPAGLAVDAKGDLYVIDHVVGNALEGPFEIIKFNSDGECLICGAKLAQPSTKSGIGPNLLGLATSEACEIDGSDLYVTVFSSGEPSISALQSYGPPPQDVENCPPPKVPPAITDQYAVSVGDEDATVQAQINPRFWNDTTYYVQYGLQECLDSGWTTGCLTEPAPPGDLLTEQVLNRPVPTDGVLLEGLQPDTTYHFRFVAQGSGSDGSPVFGAAASFRTFPEVLAPPACPNDVFRIGLSAFLPECRAYEMVSPVDKNGGDILTQQSIRDFPVELNLSSLGGDEVTFSSEAAFADAVSAPYASQYIAKRDPAAGWQTEAISPPREKLFRPAGQAPLYELDLQYKLFSPDLGSAWLMQEADPPLDDCGVAGYINWYKRDNASGAYEAITTKAPPGGKDPLAYFNEVQGVGMDEQGRTHTIYRANEKLAVDSGPAAASISGYQLYEHISDPGGGCGETRLVSVLPAGTANPTASSAGTAAVGTAGAGWIEARENLVHNAVSADASTIYWTAAGEGPGKIYVRFNETAASATFAVSAGAARFWLASEDGSVAYFSEGETLRRFDFPGPSSTEVAKQVIGLMGAGEDGSRVYFVSKEDLDGDATGGQPNLYLLEEGGITFVATLSANDISVNLRQGPASSLPASRTASVSEDGRFLAFTSDAALTGSDNLDAESGLPDTQAFLYEADSGELRCVSCNSTGAKPTGRVVKGLNNTQRGYAAGIPPWKNQFHKPRVISEDGSRVFFESLERLVPRDTNGTQDVYAWMRGADAPACQALGAELFNPVAGGCISLISSAGGGGDASFVDSTPDGSDVLFKTPASLLPQDPGRVDLYDARVGGGFPPPPIPPCEVDPASCEEPIPPEPPVTNPGSGTGTPNFDPAKCKALQQKAKKAAAKARALRKKAARAEGAKAKALRKQAKKATKQANKKSARAQACFTGARGK